MKVRIQKWISFHAAHELIPVNKLFFLRRYQGGENDLRTSTLLCCKLSRAFILAPRLGCASQLYGGKNQRRKVSAFFI
jgi:hypothetical protein